MRFETKTHPPSHRYTCTYIVLLKTRGHAKVDNFHVPFAIVQNVLALDVAVNDLQFARCVDA